MERGVGKGGGEVFREADAAHRAIRQFIYPIVAARTAANAPVTATPALCNAARALLAPPVVATSPSFMSWSVQTFCVMGLSHLTRFQGHRVSCGSRSSKSQVQVHLPELCEHGAIHFKLSSAWC